MSGTTQADHSMQAGSDGHDGESPPAVPSSRFAGRYRLGRLLKSGNGVETFLARDDVDGVDVVVKCIEPAGVHAAARLRFEHETQVLRRLSGRGLTGLHDAGSADGRLFLVQRLVSGQTLETLLNDGPLPVTSALRVGVALAGALSAAHEAGVCHRDVKPGNVMVEGRDQVDEVTLIDFGFARSPWLDEAIRDDLVGTVRYLAPEAAGLLATPADERSDLYSLGIVLFECLTGEPPFDGGSVGDLLRQHLSMATPQLPGAGASVPRVLNAIVQRLLRKEPADRYQSAAALGRDLQEVLTAVEGGDLDPVLVIGRHDQRHSLADPAFVGREEELACLAELAEGVQRGGGGLVLLEADSGGGKSRLLTEVALHAGSAGVAVLHGQGAAQVAQRPFTLLHGVAQGLRSLTEASEEFRLDLVARLGDSAAAVVRALPDLAGVFGVVADDVGPEQFGERRSLAALAQLLGAIASPERPVLLILDDCQWADRLTVRLLAELFAAGADPVRHLGVIAAFRSEEVARDHSLRDIDRGQPLRLGPLSDTAMAQLAESMAGPLPSRAVKTLVRLADGSPFMGSAVLRGLVEGGALHTDGQGWTVDESALADVRTARRSVPFLIRRLELLSDAALRVLSVGAVLGKEFDVDEAAALAGEAASAAEIVQEARARRLLWVDERTGRCSFFHDKIREALLERLDEPQLQALHGQAAAALLRGSEPVHDAAIFDLAYHLDAAGRHGEALPYALRAAELARAQHGLDSALAHYRMAERGVPTGDVALRARIAEGLGDVLTLAGSYREAEVQLSAARSLVADRLHAAALDGKLGELAFKQGDVPTARGHLEGAMARLGRPVPTQPVVLLLRLLWELAVQVGHTLLPRLTTGRRSPEGHEEDFLSMRLYSRLAYLYWFHSGKVPCAWAHLRELNLAEKYRPSPELGQALSEHAPVMTILPWFGRALRYAERSLSVRRDLNDIWGQGQSLGFKGVALYAASRYEEAERMCREALRLLEQTGDRWEANTAGWNLALCLYRAGELDEAAAVARGVYYAALEIGDQTAAGVALSVWTRSAAGDVDPALIARQLDQGSEDASTTAELQLAAALCALHRENLPEARRTLVAATATIKRAGLRQEYVAPVPAWKATVLRRLAERVPHHNAAERRRALRAAARAVRAARLWAWGYKNNAPHALREAGLVAALQGRPRRARRLLERSLSTALRQQAAFEVAQTRLALLEARATDYASPELVAARAGVRAFHGTPDHTEPHAQLTTVSLFDRFTTLLSVARTITAAPTAAALESAVRDAAIALLRGDRCHLVAVGEDVERELISHSGESLDSLSSTLIAQAVDTLAPVVASDPTVDASESLVLSGIRSVLAAPIVVDGQVRSCFYISHRQIGQLFGEEEKQLAAFIATLAGAAYEHLAGNESRLHSLAQHSSNVLTLVDRAGRITHQSSSVERVFSWETTALVGHELTSWVHPDDLDRFNAALEAVTPTREVRVECRLRRADGQFLLVETVVTDLLADPTVGSYVLNTRDITERRVLEDELRERALHDALTGLPNRTLFLERATHALTRRQPRPLVVCFIDLDDFKAVNDTLGHGAGDELLQAMAERLAGCLRPGDTVARFGGDEFALLLEDTDLETALKVVARVLAATAAPVRIGDAEVVVHTSVGLAPSDGTQHDPDQLLAEADIAMYAAKARGSHCYEVFDPAMRVLSEVRSRSRAEIEHALANEEFLLHYQPIVDLRTDEQLGVEALIRWAHPDRGLLSPAEFIDHAETNGQISAIGSWVLSTACRAMEQLPAQTRLSINVSARQLQQSDLVGAVAQALDTYGLPPHRLVLEITETAAVRDFDGAIARLNALKSLGVQLALDDFGTGYSPLSYLRQFPIDYLKIDRSFVRGIATSEEDRAIVRGVIDMAHALGVHAVAEGVENAAQQDILRDLGCDLGQGFLWCRPVELAELTAPVVPGPRHSPDTAPSVLS